LLFLNSEFAAQAHWGDVAAALQDFPPDLVDLGAAEFWDEWMSRWKRLGDDYAASAEESLSEAGARRLFRSAAACYHWAEFMYFTDTKAKTAMRSSVKECFRRSLDPARLAMTSGELAWNDVRIPYYLVLPQSAPKVSSGQQQRFPCVILCNGLDSVTEVEIFAFAEQFLARGIAVFLFDGPGQGINVGRNPIEIRFERVVETILQRLREECVIDARRIGFFGVSFGGYFALRVAKHLGERFRCVVNYSGGPRLSPFAGLPRRLKEDFRFAFMRPDAESMQDAFDALALDMSGPIDTDVLSIHGARDDIFPLAALEPIGGRHTLRVYPSEAHVCLNYLNRNSIDIADWSASRLFHQA
jgi:pimeloyl-ACP methyl ester carboxylesterase